MRRTEHLTSIPTAAKRGLRNRKGRVPPHSARTGEGSSAPAHARVKRGILLYKPGFIERIKQII